MHESIFHSLIPLALEDRIKAGIAHALKLGADGAEAYVSVSRSSKAKVQNGQLEDMSASKRGGLGVRVIKNGRCGLATTSHLTRDDFSELFQQAVDLAMLGDEDPWITQAEPSGQDDLPSRYDARIETLTPDQRVDKALSLEKETRRASGQVVGVRGSTWTDTYGASLLLTQKGVRTSNLASHCSAAIDFAVESGGDKQAAWHWDMGRHQEEIDLTRLGEEAALKARQKLNPRQLTSGRYSVVLHPEVAVDILNLAAEMLSGESVLKKRSIFAGKLGEAVASPLLTLVDDGRFLRSDGTPGFGTTPWDGEGLPTRRNVLLEDGVLKTYLHTLKSANEMQQRPTATAGRSVGSNPDITLFNLFPLPGKLSTEALYSTAGTGVLITEIMGLHTVDPVSGDLSVGASGVMIRGGQLAESVDRMTFAGNLRDFLTKIVALGNDIRWYGSQAGISILLEDMALGGA